MSALPPRLSYAGTLAAAFSLAVAPCFAAELVLQKVPPLTVEQAPAYPENVARYHFGANVEASPETKPLSDLQLSSSSEDRNAVEGALLCDDPTVGYALSNGSRTLLVSLSKIENIDSVSFLNHGAKGQITISISSAKLSDDSPQWHVVAQQELTGDAVKAKIGPTEAKYIKLTFNVTEPGRIAAFGVYSTPTVAAFTSPRPRQRDLTQNETVALISYNLTDLHAEARALYVSSGDEIRQANNMIDDQPTTTYSFSPSDSTPTTIIDLGRPMKLRRISTLYSSRPGNVEFFVLDSLPGTRQNNAPRTLKLDDSAQTNLRSVGLVMDDGSGRAVVDFAEAVGRYVMVKWTPASPADTSFSVAEIAAFGGGEANRSLIVANMTSSSRDSGDKNVESKDFGKDKEMPGEGPAEGPPPPLPQPPPFTFVPEIVPTSP